MSEKYRVLQRNLTKLEKLVVCMIYVERLTVKETAVVLEVPVAAVKKILWDVTDRLTI